MSLHGEGDRDHPLRGSWVSGNRGNPEGGDAHTHELRRRRRLVNIITNENRLARARARLVARMARGGVAVANGVGLDMCDVVNRATSRPAVLEAARILAGRLSAEGRSVSPDLVLEAISAFRGHPSWDSLSARLKDAASPQAAVPARQLPKGLYKTREARENGAPFDIRIGQMRSHRGKRTHNSSWFNRDGEKLGWGDLSEDDLVRIAREIEPGEIFAAVSEHASFREIEGRVRQAREAGLEAVADRDAPGSAFVGEFCLLVVERGIVRTVAYEPGKEQVLAEGVVERMVTQGEAASVVTRHAATAGTHDPGQSVPDKASVDRTRRVAHEALGMVPPEPRVAFDLVSLGAEEAVSTDRPSSEIRAWQLLASELASALLPHDEGLAERSRRLAGRLRAHVGHMSRNPASGLGTRPRPRP